MKCSLDDRLCICSGAQTRENERFSLASRPRGGTSPQTAEAMPTLAWSAGALSALTVAIALSLHDGWAILHPAAFYLLGLLHGALLVMSFTSSTAPDTTDPDGAAHATPVAPPPKRSPPSSRSPKRESVSPMGSAADIVMTVDEFQCWSAEKTDNKRTTPSRSRRKSTRTSARKASR